MKTWILGFLVVLLGLTVAPAYGQKGHNGSLTINDEVSSDDCSARLHWNGSEYASMVRDEESRSIPNQPLNITGEHNGGIQVTSWDKPEFSIKLCKQVSSDSEAESRRLVGEIKLDVNGSNVSVSTPSNEGDYNIGTLLIVHAPRNAELKLSVQNGGISLNHFTGTADAQAMNGGISFRHSTGKLTANAQNGGVSIKDCSGDVTLEVQNGGLSIDLPERWQGKGLEASTHNGGLVLNVPRNFESGVEVSGSEHVSFVCHGAACDHAQRTWDNGHRMLRFGNTPILIHATTVNGGIVIQEARAEM